MTDAEPSQLLERLRESAPEDYRALALLIRHVWSRHVERLAHAS